MNKSIWVAAGLSVLLAATLWAGRSLTFEERVKAQEAIERVYYNHRIWPKENPAPKPPFEALVPHVVIIQKVKEYTKKSILLEEFWQRPLTGEQLQAEMERMAGQTQDPGMLRELFHALGNDPYLIAECLARPALADRLARNWHTHDERIHGEQKMELQFLLEKLMGEMNDRGSPVLLNSLGGDARRVIWRRAVAGDAEADEGPGAGIITILPEEWEGRVERARLMAENYELHEGPFGYYAQILLGQTEEQIEVATVTWPKLSFETWWDRQCDEIPLAGVGTGPASYSLPGLRNGGCTDNQWKSTPNPSRIYHSTVWTGTEMIVWGGMEISQGILLQDGARYNPATDTWRAITGENAPEGRRWVKGVWTGTEMLVWGGLEMDGTTYPKGGGRYNPITDTWTPMTQTGAPSGRRYHTAVWAGNVMVVWGGLVGAGYLNDGGRYDPVTDSWAAIPSGPGARVNHTDLWAQWGTGDNERGVIIWGGYNGSTYLNTGSIYRPATNTWQAMTTSGLATARYRHSAVWTGSQMIIWGGSNASTSLNTGAKYNPATNAWVSATSTTDAPGMRHTHQAAWSGSVMIIWGGSGGAGGRYEPISDTWQSVSQTNEPPKRETPAVWTGTEMIVWGNSDGYVGGRYNPVTDTWVAMGLDRAAPTWRDQHTAVWTGAEMIVWGGQYCSPPTDCSATYYSLNTGGAYDPALDRWSWITTAGAPGERYNHSAVWTGSEMIIWGGYKYGSWLNTGGRYNPATGTWTATCSESAPPCNAPDARESHTAVWTGGDGTHPEDMKMIVWGGSANHANLNTGALYSPSSDSWMPTPTTNAPPARANHNAVWTGDLMVVVGGNITGSPNTGGRYVPASDTWTPTSFTPYGIMGAVWTGDVMITLENYTHDNIMASRYDPDADTWTAIDPTLAPAKRSGLQAVWTGRQVVVWGGSTDTAFTSGGRYTPSIDLWRTMDSTSGVPGRSKFSAVWSGSRMLVWGGDVNVPAYSHDVKTASGGLYCADPPWFLASENPVDFGDLPIREFVSRTITITNDGGAGLSITSVSSPMSPFGISNNTCANTTLDPGESCTLDAFFAPALPGGFSSSMTLNSTATESPSHEILLQGTAVVPDIQVHLIVPDGGESWTYSPDAEDRRSHRIFWEVDYPLEATRIVLSYSTDEGTTWTCLADSDDPPECPAKGLMPEAQNYLWEMPTQDEAANADPPQVFPSATGRIKVDVFDTDHSKTGSDDSDANFYIIKPTTTAVKTMILWHSGRMDARHPGQAAALGLKLQELADHEKVNGVVLDLAAATDPGNGNADLDAYYAAWDACYDDPPVDCAETTCKATRQDKANAVAHGIWNYLYHPAEGQIGAVYTGTQYLVLVGDDGQVPFYRMEDGATIQRESAYGGLDPCTPVGSALADNQILTDNFYAEPSPEAAGPLAQNDYAYVSDYAIGRLVETPAQIAGVINTFIAQDGQVDVTTNTEAVLVAGWDFLHDAALDLTEAYRRVADPDPVEPPNPEKWQTDALLDDPDDGGDPGFTPADLHDQLLHQGTHPLHQITALNTHATHYAWVASHAAEADQDLYCTVKGYDPTHCWSGHDLDTSAETLEGTVLYAAGCHAGVPVPNTSTMAVHTLDLPEAMAQKEILAYVGNTGWGWGMRYGKGLSEALMEKLTQELLATPAKAIGKALTNAKRAYYLEESRYDIFDEKVMHEWTLYGLPQVLIVTAEEARRGSAAGAEPAGPPEGWWEGCRGGVCVQKRVPDAAELRGLPPGMSVQDITFSFSTAACAPEDTCRDCTYHRVDSADGSYYQLNCQASGEVGDAIQPHFVHNSSLSGTLNHGILFMGGSYISDFDFDPVMAVPRSTEYTGGGEGPLPSVPTWTPGIRAAFGTTGSLGLRAAGRALGQVGYTNLVVHTGYGEDDDDADPDDYTLHRFEDMRILFYYSNSADFDPPAITTPPPAGFHTLQGLNARFQAEVSDTIDGKAGVYRVLVTYNDPAATTDQWQTLDLAYNPATLLWEGNLTVKHNLRYYLQAVDKRGNSGTFVEEGLPPEPFGTSFRPPKLFSIPLADSELPAGDGLPDAYEELFPTTCLDKTKTDTDGNGIPDGADDPDHDNLSTADEFLLRGTNPCRGDTDGGGDNDGSELNHDRDAFLREGDFKLALRVSKEGALYRLAWPGAIAPNDAIDGDYFVYRSPDPVIDPGDLRDDPAIPLEDGIAFYDDNGACGSPICYYSVVNYAIEPPAPYLQTVAPATGPDTGGTTVNIYGQNFHTGTTVYFDLSPATNVAVYNPSYLQCRTPPHAPGPVHVKVRNPDTQEGILGYAYTYTP